MKIKGVWTALVTPFDSSGAIDVDAFKKLIKFQIESGVHGVVPCGTTGESPTLTFDEKKTLISVAMEECQKAPRKIGVVAGTGSNSTAFTIALSKWADKQGVDGILIVVPYYNKPMQTGMLAHFTKVANSVSTQVVLYNVPGRTVVSLEPNTIAQLSLVKNITALKDATADMEELNKILACLKEKKSSLEILSGEDATFLEHLSNGGSGVISVASNLIPRFFVSIYEAHQIGNATKASELMRRALPLTKDLFIESNPSPVKYALHRAGFLKPFVRLPLVEISKSSAAQLDSTVMAFLNSGNTSGDKND